MSFTSTKSKRRMGRSATWMFGSVFFAVATLGSQSTGYAEDEIRWHAGHGLVDHTGSGVVELNMVTDDIGHTQDGKYYHVLAVQALSDPIDGVGARETELLRGNLAEAQLVEEKAGWVGIFSKAAKDLRAAKPSWLSMDSDAHATRAKMEKAAKRYERKAVDVEELFDGLIEVRRQQLGEKPKQQ